MKIALNKPTARLEKQLAYLDREQFSGKLTITSKRNRSFVFYFLLGRLVWGDGGKHPERSWQRHKDKYCPEMDNINLSEDDLQDLESEKYYRLIIALQQKQLDRELLKALIKSKIQELLFDLLQQETFEQLNYHLKTASSSLKLASMLETIPVLITTETVLTESILVWSEWTKKNLGFWSPNQVVKLVESDKKKQQDLANISPQLVQILDGNKTIRDLAFYCQEDPTKLVASIIPYLERGFIEFVSVEDIANPNKRSVLSNSDRRDFESLESEELPLIVGIDDDRESEMFLCEILTKAGYKYINIQESERAIPKLVNYQPNLILLDINRPVVDGHEIINQMRQVNSLKDTPVVMMTALNPIVERVRAKFIGTQGCIKKPIDAFELLYAVQKNILNN